MIYTGVNLKYLKEETVNIYNTIQKGLRGGLASVLGYCQIKCKNKQVDSEYTGKKTIPKFLDFISVCFSDMVQTLPTHQISLCNELRTDFGENIYTRSSLALALTMLKNVEAP